MDIAEAQQVIRDADPDTIEDRALAAVVVLLKEQQAADDGITADYRLERANVRR